MFLLKNQDYWKPVCFLNYLFFLKENSDLTGMCIKEISCSKYTGFLKCCDYV